jgi:hypothetical protein
MLAVDFLFAKGYLEPLLSRKVTSCFRRDF